MTSTNQVANIALLVGEPARAAMLMALMDGRALTASELARCAGITPQTASSHLARLLGAELLKVSKQGRHRYHRLATVGVARMLESIMQVSSQSGSSARKIVTGPRDQAMRAARTCYDHFAGRLGVAISDALLRLGAVEFDDDAGVVTPAGIKLLSKAGLPVGGLDGQLVRARRPLCRPCLDWSERRPHIAGKLGAVICEHFLGQQFVRRIEQSRALIVTPIGQRALFEVFGLHEF